MESNGIDEMYSHMTRFNTREDEVRRSKLAMMGNINQQRIYNIECIEFKKSTRSETVIIARIICPPTKSKMFDSCKYTVNV